MGGQMKFGVGDELSPEEQAAGPLLPLRLLVVADLTPEGPSNAGASPPDRAIRVDPAAFDDLFAALRLRIALDVPSVLSEGRATRIDLAPTSLKSFRPDGLCAEVPLLRSLLDGRLVLARLSEGDITKEQAHAELERLWRGSPFVREVLGLLPQAPGAPRAFAPAPASPALSASEPNIEELLAMVPDTSAAQPAPEPKAPPAPVTTAALPSKFGALITEVVRSARPSGGGAARPAEAVARVEKALGAQIGAILQHPEVRRLERAFRGLRLLAERTQGHTGIRIDVVSARLDEAKAALERAVKATAGAEPPVSCAIVDIAIDGSAVGWTRLSAIAEVAEALTVPVIVNGTAGLLDLPDLRGLERLDNKGALYSAPHRAPFRAATDNPAMRWVTIAMNSVLSRPPYDKSSSRVREAVIKELPADEGAFVWLAPAYAIGALVIASFRETGWPCRIVGAKHGGLLGDLPVHEVTGIGEGEVGVAIPTEVFISTDTQRELGRIGVLLLASALNSDAVIVQSASTAYVPPPKRTHDSATTEPEVRHERVSLADQLFVARVVQFLRALLGKLPPHSAAGDVQEVVKGALWALFEDTAPASLEIQVKAEPRDGGTVVAVEIRPRRFLGVGIEALSLEMPLG
jgi:type VI secretion system ImpC/EvpB family protein/type VI secretion system ImpB/VipA family protein